MDQVMKRKIAAIVCILLAVGLAGFLYFKFYFVFGEGVKAGNLNFVVYKGYIFKTYEGKIIQSGFTGKGSMSSVQSYEFEFSVSDPVIADSLMRCSGRQVELHYKEYLGALPWRGMQKHVVDGIIAVSEP